MRASRAEPEPASAGGASPVLPARLAPAPPVITPWPRSVSARVSGNASAGRSRQRRPLRKVRSGIPARFESWAGVPPPRGEPEGPRPPGSWRHPTAGKAPVMTLQGQAPRSGRIRCRSDRRGPEVGAAPPTMGRGALAPRPPAQSQGTCRARAKPQLPSPPAQPMPNSKAVNAPPRQRAPAPIVSHSRLVSRPLVHGPLAGAGGGHHGARPGLDRRRHREMVYKTRHLLT